MFGKHLERGISKTGVETVENLLIFSYIKF